MYQNELQDHPQHPQQDNISTQLKNAIPPLQQQRQNRAQHHWQQSQAEHEDPSMINLDRQKSRKIEVYNKYKAEKGSSSVCCTSPQEVKVNIGIFVNQQEQAESMDDWGRDKKYKVNKQKSCKAL